MILALNKTRNNSRQTFNNMKLFNEACSFHDLEIIDNDYTPGQAIDETSNNDINSIEVTKITPNKFDPAKYSVKTFRENIDNFTEVELRILSKDERATIKREALKELRKRK